MFNPLGSCNSSIKQKDIDKLRKDFRVLVNNFDVKGMNRLIKNLN